MEDHTYHGLLACIQGAGGTCLHLPAIRRLFPNVPLHTISSIISQEAQYRVLSSNHLHKAKATGYVERYKAGEDLLQMACSVRFPPCMLLRRMLEAMVPAPKQAYSEIMRRPEALQAYWPATGLPQELLLRLQHDVLRATYADSNYSGYSDLAKQATGLEYELLLDAKLAAAGIAYWSEADLRKQGLYKTPDARLKVPMAVRGRDGQHHVVAWIDSKATFGDVRMHGKQLDEQYRTYVNRYGPGLVIYWFGYLASLQADPDVLVLDDFPDASDIVTLPSLPSPQLNSLMLP